MDRIILWLMNCERRCLPRSVVVMMEETAMMRVEGPLKKVDRRKLQKAGYEIQYWQMKGYDYGAALDQGRLVLVLTKGNSSPKPPRKHGLPIRSMENLLQCYKVPTKCYYRGGVRQRSSQLTGPCISTASLNQKRIYDVRGAMPDELEVLIETSRGIRPLQVGEMIKAKGLREEKPSLS